VRIVNLKELADQIEKKASVDILTLPIGIHFMMRSPDGKMVMVRRGELWPIANDGSAVVALFHGEHDVRVYTIAMGTDDPTKTAPPMPPPTRHTISKHTPAIFAEMMTIETFINEIADEWVAVDEGISSADRERAAIVEFLRGKNNTISLSLVEEIEAEVHLEGDDENDKPEVVAPSTSLTTVS
jgi:uncharacterized protein with PIN domain